eukprot:3003064-Rhodomonas_salina.2
MVPTASLGRRSSQRTCGELLCRLTPGAVTPYRQRRSPHGHTRKVENPTRYRATDFGYRPTRVYAMPGTDIAYGATSLQVLHLRGCLEHGESFRVRSAMAGTDVGYGATRMLAEHAEQ